jgi:TRAP-type mannitol/chloroaromatic compound transport system permease small subunit
MAAVPCIGKSFEVDVVDFLRQAGRLWPAKLLPLAHRIDRLNEAIARLCYGIVLLTIALGTWNVLGRFLGRYMGMNLTSNALVEGQWYLFTLLFMLGGGYTLLKDGHVRVDVFYAQWNRRQRALANLVGTVLFLLPFCVVSVWASWGSIVNSWLVLEMSPDPGGLPRYPIKSSILLACTLLLLQGLSEIIKNAVILTTPSDRLGDEDLTLPSEAID